MEPENHRVVEENRLPKLHAIRFHVGLFHTGCTEGMVTAGLEYGSLLESIANSAGRNADPDGASGHGRSGRSMLFEATGMDPTLEPYLRV